MTRIVNLFVRIIIRFYQWVLSPLLHFLSGPGMGCRFQPSCSEYYLKSVEEWGLWKGSLLGVRRIARCHPFSRLSGADPVPRRKQKVG